MDNMELVIHSFFKEYAGLEGIDNAAIIISRRDGVPLYSYKEFDSNWNDSTVGALVGGIWQAAETLTQFIPNDENEEFRFSYETSSRGIFIVELCGDFEPLYLSFIYFDMLNPAKMKARVRSLESKLTSYIEEKLENNFQSNDEIFLFNEISDDEMDDLFSNVVS
ncbi:MAG: hypothetical protein BM556_09300 [Bacteriovorax sp. MedPE-SWde]|nr:MAG: hypothetical protein BM556_09300 [Bacteriovorax sp. MedPE-SWde]